MCILCTSRGEMAIHNSTIDVLNFSSCERRGLLKVVQGYPVPSDRSLAKYSAGCPPNPIVIEEFVHFTKRASERVDRNTLKFGAKSNRKHCVVPKKVGCGSRGTGQKKPKRQRKLSRMSSREGRAMAPHVDCERAKNVKNETPSTAVVNTRKRENARTDGGKARDSCSISCSFRIADVCLPTITGCERGSRRGTFTEPAAPPAPPLPPAPPCEAEAAAAAVSSS